MIERENSKKEQKTLYKIEKDLEEFEANLTNNSNKDPWSEINIHINKPNISLPLSSIVLDELI
ncbi:7219_t:CDS:1, partial [Gigaspora rosea]